MADIRRIRDGEGEAVAALWDEQNRTGIDSGPLSERGRRNIARMLDIAAWHERQLCLVAVEQETIVGFACASITAGTGLLPGLTGEIDALYVTPKARGRGTSSALAKAAIAELRARGARVIHNLICIETIRHRRSGKRKVSSATWSACRCTRGAERDDHQERQPRDRAAAPRLRRAQQRRLRRPRASARRGRGVANRGGR